MEQKTKEIKAFQAHTLREVVDYINGYFIQKEDIVTILRDQDSYSLLYYQ